MEYAEILNNTDINDIKAYAKALLKSEDMCWDCDPILIDEFWSQKVHEFLEKLAN